jgi:hypothetical protein
MRPPNLFMRRGRPTESLNAKAQRGKDAKHLSRASADFGVTDEVTAIAAELLRNTFASLPLCAFALNPALPRIPGIPRYILRSLRYLL